MFLDWVKKLSDRNGDYELFIKCEKCGHERRTRPEMFVRLVKDGLLETLRQRLRCSKCQVKGPFLKVNSGYVSKRD